jgi:hypothetical protein
LFLKKYDNTLIELDESRILHLTFDNQMNVSNPDTVRIENLSYGNSLSARANGFPVPLSARLSVTEVN